VQNAVNGCASFISGRCVHKRIRNNIHTYKVFKLNTSTYYIIGQYCFSTDERVYFIIGTSDLTSYLLNIIILYKPGVPNLQLTYQVYLILSVMARDASSLIVMNFNFFVIYLQKFIKLNKMGL